jgi:hypothetical protein
MFFSIADALDGVRLNGSVHADPKQIITALPRNISMLLHHIVSLDESNNERCTQ